MIPNGTDAAGTGPATVHDMVHGNSFPRWMTLRKVLRAVGIAEVDLSAWRQAHARAGRDDNGCPYRGLEHFGSEHVRYFFGRRELTRLLWDRVSAQIEPGGLLMVTGPSGAGKSSLPRAGLIPAADRSWPKGHVILTPGGTSIRVQDCDPVRVLTDHFCGEAAPGNIRDRLADNPAVLRDLLAQARCRLLFIDQRSTVAYRRTVVACGRSRALRCRTFCVTQVRRCGRWARGRRDRWCSAGFYAPATIHRQVPGRHFF